MNSLADQPRADNANDYTGGRQYGRPKATYDPQLTEVGAGTRMGEFLRRYWHPFALSSEINNELPLPIRILGEDLVAFRDAEGKPGLMYPRCMHRGASLVIGKVEADGLRCPYHGWKFDTKGHLLDTPCELDPTSTRLHKIVRQPWYPVIEKFGIAFTYMGPPEKEPQFPVFPLLEDLAEDEMLVPSGGSKPPARMPLAMSDGQMDFNWVQKFENYMDPLHVSALHSTINGMQFNEYIFANPHPCKFKAFGKGNFTWIGDWDNKKADVTTRAVFQVVLPNIHIEGPVFEAGKPAVSWVMPRDDTSYRTFAVFIVNKNEPFQMPALRFADPEEWGPGREEAYTTWTLEDKQRWQTDFLVQQSLGPKQLHSEEKLTTADAGVVMVRRALKEQMKIVENGGDPVGSTPHQTDVVDIYASTARVDTATGEILEGYLVKTFDDY